MSDSADRQRALFHQVWAQHYSFLFEYARRRVSTDDQADDAVAEAFTNAWLHRRDFPSGSESGARAALTRATFHAISNSQRRQRRDLGLRGRLSRERSEEPSIFPDSLSDAQVRLADAMKQLSMRDQELLRLDNWEGFDHAQIAVVMDMTPGNVAVRMHRARKQLKALLEQPPTSKESKNASRRREGSRGSDG